MAAEQTKREGKFLILFSILNFNQITDEALAFAKPMLAPVRVLNLYGCDFPEAKTVLSPFPTI